MPKDNFADRVLQIVDDKRSHVVVGLDPRVESLPRPLLERALSREDDPVQAAALAFTWFNEAVMQAVAPYAVAVKPQFAFYEMYGPAGMKALHHTVETARTLGFLVIGDGKRNDIGSTARAYAQAYLGVSNLPGASPKPVWGLDALTINGYLGQDGIEPFVDVCGREGAGVFVLVKTSNPTSGQIQDQLVTAGPHGETVATLMARRVDEWGRTVMGREGFSSVGAVVGATYPEQAAALRAVMPNALFLVPGYGAQGAGAKDVVPAFDQRGRGALVNSSRGIIFAFSKPQYAALGEERYQEAAGLAARAMRDDIDDALRAAGKYPW